MRTVTLGAVMLLTLAAGAVRAADSPPATEIVSRLESHFASVKDYECLLEEEEHNGNETTSGTYRIWFLKPDLFRLKVEQGRHRGSEIALTPSGKVRARPGGALGHVVTKTMGKTDPRLRSPRGGHPWDSNFGAIYADLRQHLMGAERAEVKRDPAGSEIVRIDVSYREPANGHTARDVYTVDLQRLYVTAIDSFEDGAQVDRMRFRDYQENTGLTEKSFDL